MDDDVEIHSSEVDDGNGWVDGNGDLIVHESGENGEDTNEEMQIDRLEQGIEDGWTRIEATATGFGGMFMGGAGRRGMAIHGGAIDERNRGFIDAAEVMIGSLLRTGEISSDAIAEIEGTLGVRISHERLSRRGESIEGLRESGAIDSSFQSNGGTRREAVGTVPHVHQRNQPEVGYSFVSNSSRLLEVTSLEYVFGGPSVTSGSRNYDIVTPIQDNDDDDAPPSLSQFDLQLLPGGPTGGRTQLALHPLLCGVDLPPVNSIISDLLPHGIRARRPGHLTTRSPSDWSNPNMSQGGYLVSTSNGNIIRSNRSNSWAPLGTGIPNRDVSGPVGWTDDGLPFDSSVGDLTAALGEALRASAPHPEPAVTQEVESPQQDGTVEETEEPVEAAESSSREEQESGDVEGNTRPDDEPMADANQSPESTSEGDQVASSLAAGLRLSGDSESGANLQDRHGSENEGDDVAAEEEQQPAAGEASG